MNPRKKRRPQDPAGPPLSPVVRRRRRPGAVRSVGPDRLARRRLRPAPRPPRRQAELNIVIRTAVLTDESPHAGAGGAIALGSELVEEYEEMLLKAATSPQALAVTSGQDAAPATERAVRARAAEGGLR